MRDRFEPCWPWWCCGPAVKKARRVDRKRSARAWKRFEAKAS